MVNEQQAIRTVPKNNNPRLAILTLCLASAGLIATTVQEEGIRYVPYYDTVGVKTVCVGSTIRVEDRRYSKAECNARLSKDVADHQGGIMKCIKVDLSQTEFDAYSELAFNIGVGAFCKSTLVKKLNAGDYYGACKEILRWVKQPELAPRRKRTYDMCMTPVDTTKEVPNVAVTQIAQSEDLGPLALKPARSFWRWLVSNPQGDGGKRSPGEATNN